MSQALIRFRAYSDHPDLRLCIRVNGTEFRSGIDASSNASIEIPVDDTVEDTHVLEIELSGKTWDHTRLNDHGHIVHDALVHVSDFSVDGININQLVWEHAVYHHDENGTGLLQAHKFFGHMGCNGTMRWEFCTPFYLWLLEHM